METVRLPVTVEINILDGVVNVIAEYNPIQDIWVFISNATLIVDSIPFEQGAAGAVYPDDVDFYIDSNGNLIVEAVNPQQFSIDNNGNLIQV